jgi:hypothetical protein
MTIDQRETFGRYAAGSALFALGGLIGLSLPDADLAFYWLRHFGIFAHRSLLTHSALVPFLLYLAAHARTREPGPSADRALPLRLFVLGLCLTCALHLCFDLFPRGWNGYARVHVPLYGWTGAWFSRA